MYVAAWFKIPRWCEDDGFGRLDAGEGPATKPKTHENINYSRVLKYLLKLFWGVPYYKYNIMGPKTLF